MDPDRNMRDDLQCVGCQRPLGSRDGHLICLVCESDAWEATQ